MTPSSTSSTTTPATSEFATPGNDLSGPFNTHSFHSFTTNEENILEILANYGPVSVAVNALLWQHYREGIIGAPCDGSVTSLNHAVQIVGYDRTGPVPYYIVQNSWGSDYGEEGYVKVEIGKNICGIANQVSIVRI